MNFSEKTCNIFYITLGSISLALGTLGIFLPFLPTTPFYLLTAWAYLKGSEKLYQKMMDNNYFGTIVRDFKDNKAIPLKTKIISVSLLWITILSSAFFFVSVWWIRVLLIVIAIGVTVHILSYKTKKVDNV
jgi:uncharacterized membrane protein YbaN (DUF454 family)